MYHIAINWTKIQEKNFYSKPFTRPITFNNHHNDNLLTSCWRWVRRWWMEIPRKINKNKAKPLMFFWAFSQFSELLLGFFFCTIRELDLNGWFSNSFSQRALTEMLPQWSCSDRSRAALGAQALGPASLWQGLRMPQSPASWTMHLAMRRDS